jgi:hypothetical protein
MKELLWQQLFPTVLSVAGAALALAMARVAMWLHGRAEVNKLAIVGERIWALAQAVVAHVEVHLRPQIAHAMEDGSLSQEEALHLKAEAVRLFKEAAGDSGLREIRRTLSLAGASVDTFISGTIERAVTASKPAAAPQAFSMVPAAARP